MDQGYLIVSVYANSIGNPINGATVVVKGDNYENSFITNNSGQTPRIELDAPLKKYSLTPQTEVRPYSVYQLEVSAPGYKTTILNGVQIFPDQTSLQNVFLTEITSQPSLFKTFAAPSEEIINLPPHSLWEETIQSEQNRTESIEDHRVLPYSIIPEYIIVHNGAPTDRNATNYFISFPDYIKNVGSSEIYSTWPVESIKANIYAIISFTMNRIFSEWYKSQGYNFTITSLPRYDQTYIHNRTIFKSISDVVDQIFDSYIQLPGKNYPFLAQYNDGIKTNNSGWLSQWGSKSLADQGLNYLQILKYYYGNGITIENADKSPGLPTSFPGYNLNVGSCGEPVEHIQKMINTISNNYPKIPKINPVNGQFQDNTRVSVETFQEVFGLPITGVIDFTTWYRINYIYVAVSRMAQGL